jgi:hypothetical protein
LEWPVALKVPSAIKKTNFLILKNYKFYLRKLLKSAE